MLDRHGRRERAGLRRSNVPRFACPASAVACWLTLAGNAAVWAGLCLADDWVLPSLIAYGPRWVWAVPPLLLLPVALRCAARHAGMSGVALLIAVAGIMRFELPQVGPMRTATEDLIVLTLNAGYHAEPAAVRRLVLESGAHVVALQEWRQPAGEDLVAGHSISCDGGLCVASSYPMEPLGVLHRSEIGGSHYMAKRVLVHAPGGAVVVATLHLETAREGIEALMQRRQEGLQTMRAVISARDLESRLVAEWVSGDTGPVIVAGDFNLSVDSAIYRRWWTRWTNAFGAAGWGYGHTKFTRWWGVRIDHILVDPSAFAVRSAWNGPAVGSDHRPVLAVLQRK